MTKTAVRKYLASLFFALIVFSISIWQQFEWALAFVLAWNVFGISYLIFNLILFSKSDVNQIQKQCSKEDVSSWILFAFVVSACMIGLLSVLSFMNNTSTWQSGSIIGSILCISAVGFSWLMVHLAFAVRYAHLFYGDNNKQFSKHAKGLIFPEDDLPDYFDFAYFSIVIGMTFQVSDVVITSKGVRRLVLIHSIIAFIFNTVIIAMTVSQVIGMNNK
jgi:uncharacterized membrane protein